MRTASGAFVATSRIGWPSSQVIVNSRRVDSSGIGRGTATPGSSLQDLAVEPHVRGLAQIIQFLAQPVGDLGMDRGRPDRAVVALVKPHRQLQLAQIGFDGGGHLGILQFAGEPGAVARDRAMHLAQRGGARRGMLEAVEAALPLRPQFADHAAAHERPAHRRRVRLQLDQLADIFLGQGVRDRGEELSHLHQRPLDAAERGLQIGGVAFAVDRHAEIALAGEARGEPAHRAADPGIAPDPAAEAVLVGHWRCELPWLGAQRPAP